MSDDAVSLRSPKAKDGEERSVVGEGDVSLYVVEGERQGFKFGDDDDGGHSSDSSLTCTPLWYVKISVPRFSITEIMLNP